MIIRETFYFSIISSYSEANASEIKIIPSLNCTTKRYNTLPLSVHNSVTASSTRGTWLQFLEIKNVCKSFKELDYYFNTITWSCSLTTTSIETIFCHDLLAILKHSLENIGEKYFLGTTCIMLSNLQPHNGSHRSIMTIFLQSIYLARTKKRFFQYF